MKTTLLTALQQARAEKRPTALVTELSDGTQALVAGHAEQGTLGLTDELRSSVEKALAEDRGRTVESGGQRFFIQIFNPPKRLVLIGAVHIAQPLVRMAASTGYAVTVIDPRGAFATLERFPGVALSQEWPDDALTALEPDRRTAIVTLTHDPKLDDPALAVALRSDAFYIGALGSRRTHARRLDRLREMGFSETDFARIHGPVGLSIGAVSPAEIALSILGQITQVLHARRTGGDAA